MRVGILTFHRAVNYGAVLQAWALQTFLQSRGYDASIIDYRCKPIENNYKLFSRQKLYKSSLLALIKYVLSHLYHYCGIMNRNKKFVFFIETRFNLKAVNCTNDLDAVITGSDQVWNPYLTGGLDNYYFLNMPEFADKRKIAYAVSGEKNYFSDNYVKQITPIIEKIHNISVRESNLKDVLKLKNISVCVDPTFLLTNKEWSCLGNERLIENDYIFLFEVVHSPISKLIAKELSTKYGIKVIYLNSGFKFLKRNTNIKMAVGPEEFVSLIRYARFVVTTSFHGMAISLLLRKQFFLAPTTHMNRQQSLLKQMGMEDRIIKNLREVSELSDIQYSDEIFVQFAKSSQNFLLSSLGYEKNIEDIKVN